MTEIHGLKLPAHKAGLYLKHNEHKDVYETVEEWAMNSFYDDDDWASMEEKAKAIETNELWHLQWYPDTPIGFCTRLASTLEALLEGLEE